MPSRSPQNDPIQAPLSQREREILTHVGEAKSNDEIASALGISRRTVEKHLENVYAKLGVNNRLQAFLKFSSRRSVS